MSERRILTTHLGSLIRPPAIIERMRAYEAGEPVDDASFERELSGAVMDVVRKQTEIGIDVPSDGEFGKRGWTQYVSERTLRDGVSPWPNSANSRHHRT